MTHATRRHLTTIAALALTLVALVAAACGPATSSATPSSPASPSITPSPPPSASPSPPSASPSVTLAPTATPAPTPAPSTACVVTPQTGQLPSDRFINLGVSSGATADRLTFVFGNPSLPGPAAPPQGSLEIAQPPYTQAGSGATIEVTGEHVIQIRFSGMSLQNDTGQETYTGPADIKPDLPALRHAVIYDASEGIVGLYVGYDGPGCVTLARDGNDVRVTIDHP